MEGSAAPSGSTNKSMPTSTASTASTGAAGAADAAGAARQNNSARLSSTSYLSATPAFVWCLHFSVPYGEEESPVKFEDYGPFFRVDPEEDYSEYALLVQATQQRRELAEVLRRASPAGMRSSIRRGPDGGRPKRASQGNEPEYDVRHSRTGPSMVSTAATNETVDSMASADASLYRTSSVDSNDDPLRTSSSSALQNETSEIEHPSVASWSYDEVLTKLKEYEDTLLEIFGLLLDEDFQESASSSSFSAYAKIIDRMALNGGGLHYSSDDDNHDSDSDSGAEAGGSAGGKCVTGLMKQPGFAWSSTLDSDIMKRWIGDICLEIVAVLSNRAVGLVRKATIGSHRLGKNEAKMLREAAGIYDWLGASKVSLPSMLLVCFFLPM